MVVKGILIDIKNGCVKDVEIDDLDIDKFHEIIDCNCIDVTNRTIEGKLFTFVCDDEGLLRSNPIPSAVDTDRKPMLVGNIFVCKHRGAYLKSLSDKDRHLVEDHINYAVYKVGERFIGRPILVGVEYPS